MNYAKCTSLVLRMVLVLYIGLRFTKSTTPKYRYSMDMKACFFLLESLRHNVYSLIIRLCQSSAECMMSRRGPMLPDLLGCNGLADVDMLHNLLPST